MPNLESVQDLTDLIANEELSDDGHPLLDVLAVIQAAKDTDAIKLYVKSRLQEGISQQNIAPALVAIATTSVKIRHWRDKRRDEPVIEVG